MSGLRDTAPPFYWRRVYTGATDMDEVTTFHRDPDGTLRIVMGVPRAYAPPVDDEAVVTDIAAIGLVIYGRAVDVDDDPHDHDHIARMRRVGQVFSECFSVQCPDGETGTHPLAAVTEISWDEFDLARRRGWSS